MGLLQKVSYRVMRKLPTASVVSEKPQMMFNSVSQFYFSSACASSLWLTNLDTKSHRMASQCF